MKRTIPTLALTVALAAGLALALPQQSPAPKPVAKPDNGKVVGDWNLDVFAGGMTITLNLTLAEAEGKLAGKISEPNGMFTDVALTGIQYDGETLTYDISVPSPPDGAVKTWKTELKVGEDAVEGGISNAEAGMSATITGKRVKK
jgi:hypothetical protein